ncbi:hypothetical protein NDU88_003771 [Pleurodeles waltl]|uniref:Uncharacterized protein n=1 Tax=Pleurodeles waltl TaxID=8319 RepID=A0AAV7WVS5_PLEWA|nr:hypothetical protein NDU88_003771 [Pleurodeles waltl]
MGGGELSSFTPPFLMQRINDGGGGWSNSLTPEPALVLGHRDVGNLAVADLGPQANQCCHWLRRGPSRSLCPRLCLSFVKATPPLLLTQPLPHSNLQPEGEWRRQDIAQPLPQSVAAGRSPLSLGQQPTRALPPPHRYSVSPRSTGGLAKTTRPERGPSLLLSPGSARISAPSTLHNCRKAVPRPSVTGQ